MRINKKMAVQDEREKIAGLAKMLIGAIEDIPLISKTPEPKPEARRIIDELTKEGVMVKKGRRTVVHYILHDGGSKLVTHCLGEGYAETGFTDRVYATILIKELRILNHSINFGYQEKSD